MIEKVDLNVSAFEEGGESWL